MGKFNGIVEYHDGIAISEYMNMLPMGDTCLDRVGDRLVYSLGLQYQEKYRGSFKDSEDNIYIVAGAKLFRFAPNTDHTDWNPPVEMQCWKNDQLSPLLLRTHGSVSFCESSIKPTIVFLCDGTYIYMWNTTSGTGSRAPFIVNGEYLPGMEVPGGQSPRDGVAQPNVLDYIDNDASEILNTTEDGISHAASICWFDNKLVMRASERNTVWISKTDPGQYFNRKTNEVPTDPLDGFPLWNSWYSSTNSADKLVDIASFRGQLYLINTHSIEIWGRTGNEDSPIQSNTTQVIHYGGRCPVIIQDTLFVIYRDASGHEGVGAFTDHFQKISTPEIERRLGTPIDLQLISQRHENYLFVRTKEASGFLFREGRWSSWQAPKDENNPVVCTIYGDIAASLYGDMLAFDETLRTTCNGKAIRRYIRDGFEQFPRRVIFRRVECVMDTGRYGDEYPNEDYGTEVYVALSTNRGLNFGQPHFRKFGTAGHNNKVIEWRNLGSGNSVLLEVGTTALNRLQIYDIKIEAQ